MAMAAINEVATAASQQLKRRSSAVTQIESGRPASSEKENGESSRDMVGQWPTDRQVAMLLWVFDSLDADYGARWNPNQKPLIDGEQLTVYGLRWVDQLSACTRADILRGLSRLRTERPEWPPGAAGFAELCTPTAEDLGLPTLESAYRSACNGDWSNPAVWHAVQTLGARRLRMQPERQTRRPFEKIWQYIVTEVRSGRQFDPQPVVPALEHLPTAPLADRIANSRAPIAEIRQVLNQSTPQSND